MRIFALSADAEQKWLNLRIIFHCIKFGITLLFQFPLTLTFRLSVVSYCVTLTKQAVCRCQFSVCVVMRVTVKLAVLLRSKTARMMGITNRTLLCLN